MLNLKPIFFLITFCLLIATGCSGGTGPVTPSGPDADISVPSSLPVGVTDSFPDGNPAGGIGALGLFTLSVDPGEISADLVPFRQTALTDVLEVVDITNFLQMAPCTDCAEISTVSLDTDGNVVVTIGIKHPFEAGDLLKPISGKNRADLHVFNVEGTIISNSTGNMFPALGQTAADFAMINADGYSGYLDRVLDDLYPTDATIHPYILHFDDYSAGNFDPGNPMGFGSVTDPPPSGNLVMAMGCDYDYQDYVFNLVGGAVDFIYAVGCTYAISSASKNQRFDPEYRLPQHNKKAASEVSFEVITNDLTAGDINSTAEIEIHVVDISHGVGTGSGLDQMHADSSVSGITIEIPGVEASQITVDISSPTGSGHDPTDPLVFSAIITNTVGADEGIYTGLLKVTDNYAPGQNESSLLNGMDGIKRVGPTMNPLEGLFAIPEFATYQVFDLVVQEAPSYIEVLIPNGGEEWSVGSDREITWTSEYIIGTVFIEYSKDNFNADIHPIATGETNDGSFMWEGIPNDPSTSVRVRVSSTDDTSVFDISDADFSIVVSGWARTWGGSGADYSHDVATDGSGNVYVAGRFTGTVDFDPSTTGQDNHSSNGGDDIFLSKFDSSGSFIWAKTWGGSGTVDVGDGVAVDGSGNVYVCGRFSLTVDFDPSGGQDNHSSNGGYDVYLSKFDSSGNFLWAKTWGGISTDIGYGVAVGGSDVYVIGAFNYTVDFDPSTTGQENHSSNGSYDVYLSKFDSTGNFLWARTFGGSSSDYGYTVTADGSGNLYLTGAFSGTADFDPSGGLDNHSSNGGLDVFLSKLDSSGNFLWAKTWGWTDADRGYVVAADGSDVYVTGYFSLTVDFDPSGGLDNHSTNGGYDVFLSKFDSSGSFIWAKTWGWTGADIGYAVAPDGSGNLYVAGHFYDIVDFDPSGGQDNHTSNGFDDVFLSKFDSLGDHQWTNTWGGISSDSGYFVTVGGSDVFVTGYFNVTVDFDPGTGVDNHTSNGSNDVFLSKFLPDGSW